MNFDDQHPVHCKGSPQTSLTVRIYPEFVNSLRTLFESSAESRSSAESGGLLFGTAEEGVVILRAFKPFATWDKHQTAPPRHEQIDNPSGELDGSFSAEPDLRDSALVGWCYVRQAGSIGLLERDIRFHNRHFQCAMDLLLILNSEQGQDLLIELFAAPSNVPLSPKEFRWGCLHVIPDPAATQPIDVNLEERSERDDLRPFRLAPEATSGVPANTVALLRDPQWRRTNGLRLLVSSTLFVFVIVVTFAGAHTLMQYWPLTPNSRSVLSRSSQNSDLRMEAENGGDGILLSWNRHAAAVQSAKQGILHVQDGSEQRTIYLDPNDVANSSIVYRPDSSDASFRLEILGDHGSTISSSVRAHDNAKSVAGRGKPDGIRDAAVVGENAAPPGNPEALPNYVPARALKQVLPDQKFFASWNVREGMRVDVQVRIDETGRVIDAHVKNGVGENDLLRNAILAAANQWVFEPAKSDGKNIQSDHTIEFRLHP